MNNKITEVIDSFKGEYAFLSNFYRAKCYLDGWQFPTTEHAYQAAKSLSRSERLQILNADTPKQAKHFGYKVTKRSYWDEDKVEFMKLIVRSKFRENPDLAQKLINTGDKKLIEGNTWGDTFWGVCNGEGLNYLGKILMELRQEFKQKIQ